MVQKKILFSIRSVVSVLLLSGLIFFVACGDEDPLGLGGNSDKKKDPCKNCKHGIERFNGTYETVFQVDQASLPKLPPPLSTKVTVADGKGKLEIRGTYEAQPAEVVGDFTIDNNDGKITAKVTGKALGVDGTVDLKDAFASVGMIGGLFSIKLQNGQEVATGQFRGILDGALPPEQQRAVVKTFDGLYEIYMQRQFQQDASSKAVTVTDLQFCMKVTEGKITQTLEDIFQVEGYVQETGVFAINGILGSQDGDIQVYINGNIAQNTVSGNFQVSSSQGELVGKKVDVCPIKSIFPDPAPAKEPGIAESYLLCSDEIDTSGSGITGFFGGVFSTLLTGDAAYCRKSDRCKFMDDPIKSPEHTDGKYTSKESCVEQCEKSVTDKTHKKCHGVVEEKTDKKTETPPAEEKK